MNEEDVIEQTLMSLGFGGHAGDAPLDTVLILVDNRSTDNTRPILERVKRDSAVGAVVVVEEPERGYVPPRHRGVLAAQEYAQRNTISSDELLILQCDADTTYDQSYIGAMLQAAERDGLGALFEATVRPPAIFLEQHPRFQQLSDAIDVAASRLCGNEAEDVIVCDAASGFSLATYFKWGGHERAYSSSGPEIHAETSRLFIRGRARGGHRVSVADAVAKPSRRKIVANPVRHFATAGFPRGDDWWRDWSANYIGPNDLDAFEHADASKFAQAIAARTAHLIVLFGALPSFVERTLDAGESERRAKPAIEDLIAQLSVMAPRLKAGDAAAVLEAALALVDKSIDAFGAAPLDLARLSSD